MSGATPDLRIMLSDRPDGPTAPEIAYLFNEVQPDERVWLASADRKLVGGIKVALSSGQTGINEIGPNVVIDSVSIVTGDRRKGYGRALMKFVESWLQEQTDLPHRISLAVETDNGAAIGMYESLGYAFVLDGESHRLTTADGRCFVMAKDADKPI